MFYKNLWIMLLIPSLITATTADEQKASAARTLAFYKHKATECAAKTTSALILDVTKKAAIGAVIGAGAGASLVGLHMLDTFMHPTVEKGSYAIFRALMPFQWDMRTPVGLGFSEGLIRGNEYTTYRCTNFGGYRCAQEFMDITGAEKIWFDKPQDEWTVPLETSIATLKTMRSNYIKRNLCTLGLRGAAIGALLGTSYALYKQYYASTPEWLAQLDLLEETDFAPDPIMVGGKAYLVSQQFSDISITDPSYELYFMPRTAELVTVYKQIIATLESLTDLKKHIACVSIRLVPSSSYSGLKVLPRIVVQLYPYVSKQDANKILAALYDATKKFIGDGKKPRYSSPVTTDKNNLIFVAFGSGDMKDKNPRAFERKGAWFWRAADDLAYQNTATQALSLTAN